MHLFRTRRLVLAQGVYSFLSLSRLTKPVHWWGPVCAGSGGHIFPGDSPGYVCQLPSFASHRNGGSTETKPLWYCTTLSLTLSASALSVSLLHLLTWKLLVGLKRCCPVHQRVWSWAEHLGTAWGADGAPQLKTVCLACIHI